MTNYFTLDDAYLHMEGTHRALYEKLGAHVIKQQDEILGTHFAV